MFSLARLLVGSVILCLSAANRDGSSLLQLAETGAGRSQCPENLDEQILLNAYFQKRESSCREQCEKSLETEGTADDPKYLYIHIPKTGGMSFLNDARKILGQIPIVHNGETWVCLSFVFFLPII